MQNCSGAFGFACDTKCVCTFFFIFSKILSILFTAASGFVFAAANTSAAADVEAA